MFRRFFNLIFFGGGSIQLWNPQPVTMQRYTRMWQISIYKHVSYNILLLHMKFKNLLQVIHFLVFFIIYGIQSTCFLKQEMVSTLSLVLLPNISQLFSDWLSQSTLFDFQWLNLVNRTQQYIMAVFDQFCFTSLGINYLMVGFIFI